MKLFAQLALSILLASPTCAAIARVQKADSSPGSSSVTLTGTTAGNFLMVSASWADTASDPTVSDTTSSTWNPLPVLRGPTGQDAVSIKLFYAMNIAGGTTTITLSSSPPDVGIHVVEYSGVATSVSLDVTNTAVAAGSTTTPTSGSFTPTAGDLIYAYFAAEQTQSTAGTGYAIIATTGNHVDASEDNLSATGGAQTASFTLGTASNTWALYVATFKAATPGLPTCGKLNDTNVYTPPNYDTFVRPGKGNSYIDPVFGCKITQITDAASMSWNSANHFYSTVTPFNADDSYLYVFSGYAGTGSGMIVDLNGNPVVSNANMPATNSAIEVWDTTNPKVIYYTSGNQFIKGTISGMPPNVTVSPTVLQTFTQYSSVVIPGDMDLSNDGLHIWLTNAPDMGGNQYTADVFLVTLNAGNGAATSATMSTKLSSVTYHKLQIVPNNGVSVEFNGRTIYNPDGTVYGTPGGSGNTEHTDWGLDSSGKMVAGSYWYSGTPQNGCANSQWDFGLLDLASNSVRLCLLDSGVRQAGSASHVSARDMNSKQWMAFSIEGGSGSCPSTSFWCYNNPTSLPTQTGTCTNSSNWCVYTGEIIVGDTSGNTVRLAHHRSRTDETYWAQTRASISRDGKYILFDSNYNQSGTIGGVNYTDVYLIGPLY